MSLVQNNYSKCINVILFPAPDHNNVTGVREISGNVSRQNNTLLPLWSDQVEGHAWKSQGLVGIIISVSLVDPIMTREQCPPKNDRYILVLKE